MSRKDEKNNVEEVGSEGWRRLRRGWQCREEVKAARKVSRRGQRNRVKEMGSVGRRQVRRGRQCRVEVRAAAVASGPKLGRVG